jgi:hypothetical protein
MTTPFVGFSNDRLATLPKIKSGDAITCPACGAQHVVRGGLDPSTNTESDLLLFYNCGDKSCLAAVGGRDVTGAKPSVSGKLGAAEVAEAKPHG